jgi:hypothetical protein
MISAAAMSEDCHALISKTTESGQRVPQDVRHLIADFVNGIPDTFDQIPQEAKHIKAIEQMWPAVQRWELSNCVNYFQCLDEHRITIFLKTDRASLRFLKSIGASVSLDSRDQDGDWEEALAPEFEQDHYSSKRVVPCCERLINDVRRGKYKNLRCMYCYSESTLCHEEVNRLFRLRYGYDLWECEDSE